MNKVQELAKMIDHSILHPTLTDEDLIRGCEIAMKYNVASVCVKPYHVKQAALLLQKSDVKVGSVIGFPHGNSEVEVKVFETKTAIKNGAVEIDMVINIGKALQEDWPYIENEIHQVVKVCHEGNAVLKVIFETDFLPNNDYIIKLCDICTKEKVDYVKTSSGFGFVKQPNGDYNYKGATIEHLLLMHKHIGGKVKVKAAGGIRTLDQLLAIKETGATRCGATATESILEEAKKRFA